MSDDMSGSLAPDPVIGGSLSDPPLLGAVVVEQEIDVDLGAGQGIAGPPGTGNTYVFPFAGQTTWAVSHNLGRFPSVTVVETSGDVILGALTYVDANNLRIDFTFATSGVAYLN